MLHGQPGEKSWAPSAAFEPPLTVIVKAGDQEVFRVAVPKEIKLSTPAMGAQRIVISLKGSLGDIMKLLEPEEPAPPLPGQPAPPKPGPPLSTALTITVQGGPNLSATLSGSYDFEARRAAAGLSFVLTTSVGQCALPSASSQAIIDAIRKLEPFGVQTHVDRSQQPPAVGAPKIEATQIPEAAVKIGEAVSALVSQLDAMKKAEQQCAEGKDKQAKVEITPSVGVTFPAPPEEEPAPLPGAPARIGPPIRAPRPSEPEPKPRVDAGVNLRIYFD
jgi:hypothetical protein